MLRAVVLAAPSPGIRIYPAITNGRVRLDLDFSSFAAMMRRSLLLLALTVAGVACSAGTTASPGTSAPSVSGTPGTTAPTGTAAAASSTCRGTTAGTAASGGADVTVPGDIPDNAHFVTYRGAGYHLDHPEGWAQQASGTTVTFTDKFNSIQVTAAPAAAAPTVAGAQAGDVAALQASAPCFQAGKVTQVTRSAGPAILITYRADSPPDPVTGKVVVQDVERYEFWRSGTLVSITLSSPKGSDNVDPWRKVTDSFGWGA